MRIGEEIQIREKEQRIAQIYTDISYYGKLTMQNIEEFCFVSIVKMGHLLLHIFGPHVLETVYTSFEPSARV
jgi:hypothetical protein